MSQIYSFLMNWTKYVTNSFPGSPYFPPPSVHWGWQWGGGAGKRENLRTRLHLSLLKENLVLYHARQTNLNCPLSLVLLSNGHLLITGSVVLSQANKELRDLYSVD